MEDVLDELDPVGFTIRPFECEEKVSEQVQCSFKGKEV